MRSHRYPLRLTIRFVLLCGMDRKLLLRHLAAAERHVAEREDQIARQRDLVAELEGSGRDAKSAKKILSTFEATQAQHLLDRERIRQELGEEAL